MQVPKPELSEIPQSANGPKTFSSHFVFVGRKANYDHQRFSAHVLHDSVSNTSVLRRYSAFYLSAYIFKMDDFHHSNRLRYRLSPSMKFSLFIYLCIAKSQCSQTFKLISTTTQCYIDKKQLDKAVELYRHVYSSNKDDVFNIF